MHSLYSLWISRFATWIIFTRTVYILPIMHCGCNAGVNKAAVQQIDALEQWRLQWILNIRWQDFVRYDICDITEQVSLSSSVKS